MSFEQTTTDRISLDLDGPQFTNIAFMRDKIANDCYFLKSKGLDVLQAEGYISSSGNGIHLIYNLSESISFPQQIQLRAILGDDDLRIIYSIEDYKKGKNPDVMFTTKKYGKVWKKRKLILTMKYEPPQEEQCPARYIG